MALPEEAVFSGAAARARRKQQDSQNDCSGQACGRRVRRHLTSTTTRAYGVRKLSGECFVALLREMNRVKHQPLDRQPSDSCEWNSLTVLPNTKTGLKCSGKRETNTLSLSWAKKQHSPAQSPCLFVRRLCTGEVILNPYCTESCKPRKCSARNKLFCFIDRSKRFVRPYRRAICRHLIVIIGIRAGTRTGTGT